MTVLASRTALAVASLFLAGFAVQSTAQEPQGEKGPLILRVGLASDLTAVTLPCCDGRLTLELEDESLPLSAEVRISPAATLGETAVYRLQIAALKDERQASGLAEQLTESTGYPADATFDAGTDLYRVRVGRFATRGEADRERGRMVALGFGETWVAIEGGDLEDPALEIISQARGRRMVPGRWLEVRAPRDVGIPWDKGRYRGSLLVFLNDRGHLNIVNELALEDYLRGVVPKEMGPELYKQLEALKAQTVAARTYVVRNLGEFAGEGFDICSTPRCQVYGGMSVEHPLSDRAITETRGQVVLYDGQPAETMYGATCGGHTENIEVIFPLKSGPYLRGVPCLEAGIGQLSGDAPSGSVFPSALVHRMLPASGGKSQRVLSARLEQLARLAGLSVPRDRLKSMQRREVLRFAMSLFDLALDRRLRAAATELEQLIEEPPDDWRQRDLQLARFLAGSPLTAAPGKEIVSDQQADELLFRLALYLGVLERQSTRYQTLAQNHLQVRDNGPVQALELPGSFMTFRRQGDTLRAAPLEMMAGDHLDLYRQSGQLIALVQPDTVHEVRFGHRVPKQKWSRFVSAQRLRQAVQTRYPGFPFEDFEVLERGVSGRVGKLRLLGTGGRSLDVEGLAVRWTLDVWDNLFWAQPSNGKNREPGWTFRGKGWGHGVGMCQAGTFGMAMRGANYRDILEHYYSGIELGRLKPAPPRPRLAGAAD